MKNIDNKEIKVLEYIKSKGMGNILAECGNNLRAVKNHLIRECHLPKNKNISYTIKKFKQYLENRLWEQYGKNVELVEKSLRMNFGGEDVR